MRNVKNMKI